MPKIYSQHYILLADQPWQANVMCHLAKNILAENPDAHMNLVFTDYYSFLLRRDYLEGITVAFPGKVITMENIYRTWQVKTAPIQSDPNYLRDWEKKYCKTRTLKQIERTNQWIYGNERNRYQRKITPDWAERILADTVEWVQKLAAVGEHKVFISIERSTLPTNLLYEIASTEGLPFLTFFPSRINTRWLMRDDFGYGMPKNLANEIQEKYSSSDMLRQARDFIHEEMSRKAGSYLSLGHEISEKIQSGRSNFVHNFGREIRLWLGRVYGRIFIQPRERSVPAVRLVENLVSLSYVEVRRALIIQLRTLGLKFWGTDKPPNSKKYFLWALHMRPEGSVLVLGDGKDEISELFRTANLIPDGYFLAVKENPEMFGLRAPGFYRKLKQNPKIILIDPIVPTYKLIKESVGVIGISGTVLLESTFFCKPSCALGKPEFSEFLVENGWNSAEVFFHNVITQKYPDPLEKMLPYIAYVVENSHADDIAFEGDLSTLNAESMIKRFSNEIQKYLAN